MYNLSSNKNMCHWLKIYHEAVSRRSVNKYIGKKAILDSKPFQRAIFISERRDVASHQLPSRVHRVKEWGEASSAFLCLVFLNIEPFGATRHFVSEINRPTLRLFSVSKVSRRMAMASVILLYSVIYRVSRVLRIVLNYYHFPPTGNYVSRTTDVLKKDCKTIVLATRAVSYRVSLHSSMDCSNQDVLLKQDYSFSGRLLR